MTNENEPQDATSEHTAPSALNAGLGRWQPIATAPMDGTPILAYWSSEYGQCYGVTCYEILHDGDVDMSGWIDPQDHDDFVPPSYWMPLPPPPNEKVQASGGDLSARSPATTG